MDFASTPTLTGTLVTLEQLSHDHTSDLADAVADGELWRTWYTAIPRPEEVPAEIDRRLAEQQAGRMAPWAIRRNDTGAICGMTTYMNIAAEHARVEIGSTWLAASALGSGINAYS
jgi:RimJ/RimL family protein N-acetyltransferase